MASYFVSVLFCYTRSPISQTAERSFRLMYIKDYVLAMFGAKNSLRHIARFSTKFYRMREKCEIWPQFSISIIDSEVLWFRCRETYGPIWNIL